MLAQQTNKHWVLIITFISIVLPPLANDLYFSSLPVMAAEFNSYNIQLTVTAYLLGFSLPQLLYGALSDHYGRRPILLFAHFLVVSSSIAIVFSHTMPALLIGRFFQAAGASALFSTCLAIIRDSYHKNYLVRVNSMLFTLVSIIPGIAPLLGSYIAHWYSWRMDFDVVAVIAGLLLVFVVLQFKETNQHTRSGDLNVRNIFRAYLHLVKIKTYRGYIFSSCFSYASLFTFIAASPYLFIQYFQQSAIGYGWLVLLIVSMLLVSGLLVPRFVSKFSLPAAVCLGAVMIFIAAAILLVVSLMGQQSMTVVILTMMLMFMGVGFIRPSASAGAMSTAPPALAGSATALFSFIAFLGGALFSTLGRYAGSNPQHLAEVIILTGLLASVAAGYTFNKACLTQ